MWVTVSRKNKNNNALNAVEKEFMTMGTTTMNEYIQSVSIYFLWKIEVTSHLALLLDGVVFFHESAGRRRSSKGKGGVKKWRSMVDASEIPFPTNHRLEWC